MSRTELSTEIESGGQPFDLDHLPPPCWPAILKPRGEGDFSKEDFEPWWDRNAARLAHLPRDLCEQWVHRHWKHSRFSGLPLKTLGWSRVSWDGSHLLATIYRAFGGGLSPEFDYKTFQRGGGEDRHPTARALDGGTWDYPMVLLSTPYGVINNKITRPDVRYVLVEGHPLGVG